MDNSLSALTTLARNWWAFILRGVVAIGFGLIAWFWPDLALNTLIWLFAFFALFTGILAIMAAVRAISQRERWLGLAAEGVIGIGAGIIAVVWPDLTAKTFLYILAAWAIVSGVLSIWSAIRLRKEMMGEWALALSGVALILFGIIAFARPKSGALAVLWLIGLSAIVFGILWVILGLELRRLHGSINQLARSVAEAPARGTAPAPVTAARPTATTASQGIASSPTSASTASSPTSTSSAPTPTTAPSSAAPAAAAAAAAAATSSAGKADTVSESAGTARSSDVSPTMGATSEAATGVVVGSSPSSSDDRTAGSEAAASAEAAAAGLSANAPGAGVDELQGVDVSSAAETIAAPTDAGIDASTAVVGAEAGATEQKTAVEGLSPDAAHSVDADESADDALNVAGAPAEADAMAASGMPSAATAESEAGTSVTAEDVEDAEAAMAAYSTSDSGLSTGGEAGTDTGSVEDDVSSKAAGVEDLLDAQGAEEVEEETIVAGSASGSGDAGDDALDSAAAATTDEAVGGAVATAVEMPRTTRRERALADLVAGLPPEGTGWVLGNGTLTNPEGYPLKGNASSRIYHAPGGQSYDVTIAEICFATAADARGAGFRPRQGDPGAEDATPEPAESAALRPTDESGALDIAPTSEVDDLVAAETVEATPGDIPSEFVSHLVGSGSASFGGEFRFDESGGGDAGETGSNATSDDAAPMGIAAVESEPQPALSRSEQALQDLIATLPPEGTGWVRGTNVYTTPPGYPVKGNASSRIYHLPGGQNYQATIPEICFATVDDARAGGFRPRHGDPAEADWSLVEETPASTAMGIGHSDVTDASGPSREDLQLQEIIAGLPPEGSGWVKGTGVYTTPYGYPIKGNASSRIYHVPGGQNYQATIPEICFASVDAARDGGFRPRHGDPAEPDWSLVEVTPGTEPMGIAAEPTAADVDPEVAAILENLPANGSGWRLGDGTPDCPASHPIKGNSSSRIFHVEEGRSYKATIPEFCFATEEDAIAAGFRRARA